MKRQDMDRQRLVDPNPPFGRLTEYCQAEQDLFARIREARETIPLPTLHPQ